MYRASWIYLTLLLLFLSTRGARAEQERSVLLRVRVTDVTATDYYPHENCPSGMECIPFDFWFKYRADVREVIRGSYNQPGVQFAILQHAYFRRMPTDWFVLVVPCGQGVRAAVNVYYCVRDQAFASDRAGRQRLMNEERGIQRSD
jgi:hypothetical protein